MAITQYNLYIMLSRFKSFLKDHFQSAPSEHSHVPIDKFDEKLTPNMRALRLSMGVADQLTSLGVGVNDVVSMALDITDTYCSRKVHIDISYTLLTYSQDRGNDREPLTLIHTVTPRAANSMVVQLLQELVRDIKRSGLSLDSAEKRLDEITAKPPRYPGWAMTLGNGGISAGVCMLYTGSPIIIFLAFLTGSFIDRVLRLTSKIGAPAFYAQIAAAALSVIIAGIVSWLSQSGQIPILESVNPTLIVIGGIVMLVAGLTIVSATQDAIYEYYITANARLLRVSMMTVGIVIGTLSGLYIAKKIGISFHVSPEPLPLGSLTWQYIGAVIMSGCYALSTQSKPQGIIVSGLVGLIGSYAYVTSVANGLSVVPASGVAAIIIGLLATLISRMWRIPSVSTMAAGIVPLVPGLTLYNGLMQFIYYPPASAFFERGVGTLFTALGIALCIGAGATFGHLIGRPLRHRFVRVRNALPKTKYRFTRKKLSS